MIAKNQPPPCAACGKPWEDHTGIQQLCARVQELEAELARLKAERQAHPDDALPNLDGL